MTILEQALYSIMDGGQITVDFTDVAAFNAFATKYDRRNGLRCHMNQATGKVKLVKTDSTPIEIDVPVEIDTQPEIHHEAEEEIF